MDNKTYSVSKQDFAAVNNALVLDVRELNTVLVTLTGTYSFTLVFEASDDNGTTWFPIQMATVNANTVAISHSTASATQAYEASCHAFTTFRVRCSAFTSAGTHTVRITGTSRAVEPAPVIQAVPSQTIATPSGSAHSLTAAATTNATSVKTTAANLFELTVDNFTASTKWFKLYNKASAPTVGTDVPVLTVPIPANSFVSVNFGQNGKRFTTGLAFAITGAQAVADTTALAAGDTHSHLTYI